MVYNPTRQEYLVVWQELPDGGWSNIHAQRVGPTGLLVGGVSILGSGPVTASRFLPAVAYASTSNLYMVVWQRLLQTAFTDDVEAQVLSGTATTIGGNIPIATGTLTVDHAEPDIAYNRSRNEYLIVWTREDRNVAVLDVWGRSLPAKAFCWGRSSLSATTPRMIFTPSVVGTPTVPNFGGYYPVWGDAVLAGGFRRLRTRRGLGRTARALQRNLHHRSE